MPAFTIPGVTVPAWTPQFHISERARDIYVWDRSGSKEPLQVAHFAGAYDAPDIVFTELGDTIVAGNSFCVRSETLGVIRESLTLINGASWARLIPPGEKLVQVDNDEPVLVVGNLASRNYYHWTLQCFASFLVFRRLKGDDDFAAIMPGLNSFQAQLVSTADFYGRLFEIEKDEVISAHKGVYANLCGGAFAFAPHPAVMHEFDALAARAECERTFSRRIYVSRKDADMKRGITNEAAVCDLMERHGFEIITPGELTIEEQMVAFRDAEIVAGPHGAGLTNLVYCSRGARVLELVQMSYFPGFYVRICQAKGLDYIGIINPDVIARDEADQPVHQRNFNNVSSEIDIALLESVLSEL